MRSKLQQDLGKNLRAIRLAAGKTLDGFSEELCIARSTLQEVESGHSNSRMDTVQVIADKLDLSPVALLSPTDEPLAPTLSLFRQLESYLKLPPQEQEEVDAAFHRIVQLLTKTQN